MMSWAAGWQPGVLIGRRGRREQKPAFVTTVDVAIRRLAVLAGGAVSGPRVYWAGLTVFFSFLMVTNTGEQLRRALFRLAGTAIGIVLSDLLVHLTGERVWGSLLIVLVSMFLGVHCAAGRGG